MQANKNHQASLEKLRRDAEILLEQKYEKTYNPTSLDTLELIEELKLHQIELELQNEELFCAKKEVEELHKDFANLYEFAPCGYLELNHKGTINRANLRAVQLLGVDRGMLVHLSLSSFFADGFDAVYLKAKNRAANTKENQSVELLLKSTDKEIEKWVLAEIAARIDEQGRVLGWRVTLVDITERKEIEKKLEEKEHYIKTALKEEIANKTEELRAAWELNKEHERNLLNQRRIKSLHDLMLNVSHHWKQPLAILTLSLALIEDFTEEDGINNQKYIEQIDIIKNSINFMADVITSFQNLSIYNTRDAFELKPALSEIIKLTKERALEDSIELELSGDEVQLEVKRDSLLDVIQSLIENSKDSILIAKKDDPLRKGKIEIEIKNLKHTTQIRIRDNGTGIDENIIDALFDPYFTTKFKSKGVGLSLYFAKLIIEGEFQGEIYLNSAFKSGAEFVIELPIALDTQKDTQSA